MNEGYFYDIIQDQNRKIERLEKMISFLTSGYQMDDSSGNDEFGIDLGCEDVFHADYPFQNNVIFNTIYPPIQEAVFFNGRLLNQDDYWVSGNHYTIEKGEHIEHVPVKLVVLRIYKKDKEINRPDRNFFDAIRKIEGLFAEDAAGKIETEADKNRINALEI